MILGTTLKFEAAHHLPNYDGPCKRVHGHSYKLEVRVQGPVAIGSGMVIDLHDLKQIIRGKILSKVDHTDLNKQWKNPTAENMLMSFVTWLRDDLLLKVSARVILHSVKLWETEGCFAEWRSNASA